MTFFQKLRRAHHHFDELVAEVESYLFDEEAYGVTPEVNADRSEHTFRLWVRRQPDPSWSLLIGDIIQNLRSALDHLVWDVSDPNVRDESTEFPIFWDDSIFGEKRKNGSPSRRSGLHKMQGVPDPGQTVIEQMQPFNRVHMRDEHPLGVLHELGRIDRHRSLHVALAFLKDSTITFKQGTVDAEIRPGPVEDRAVVARVFVPEQPVDPAVGMELEFSFGIAFAAGGDFYGWPVRETLAEILACVYGVGAGVATAVEPLVKPPPRWIPPPPRVIEVRKGTAHSDHPRDSSGV